MSGVKDEIPDVTNAMKKLNKYLILIGILLTGAGFLYDVMFAGIPYQDAPDHLAIQYNRHKVIAERIMITGLLITVSGGILLLGSKLRSRSKNF